MKYVQFLLLFNVGEEQRGWNGGLSFTLKIISFFLDTNKKYFFIYEILKECVPCHIKLHIFALILAGVFFVRRLLIFRPTSFSSSLLFPENHFDYCLSPVLSNRFLPLEHKSFLIRFLFLVSVFHLFSSNLHLFVLYFMSPFFFVLLILLLFSLVKMLILRFHLVPYYFSSFPLCPRLLWLLL